MKIITRSVHYLGRNGHTRLKARAKWELRKRQVRARLNIKAPLPVVDERGVIVFFAPEAGVTPHFAAQCLVGRTLQEMGHKVLFTRCFQLFERCPVMDLHRLPPDAMGRPRQEICLVCASSSMEMLDKYGLEHLDLRCLLTSEMTERVEQAIREAPADLRNFQFEGIAFGKLCVTDLVLMTKTSNYEAVSPETRLRWLQYIRSSILAYFLMDACCRRLKVKSLVHFNDYSLLMAGWLAARRNDVHNISMGTVSHAGGDRRKHVLLSEPVQIVARRQVRAWPEWRGLALGEARVADVAEDLMQRFGATYLHAYSPAKKFQEGDIRARIGLAINRKLIVAYTSSLDEMISIAMTLEGIDFQADYPRQPFVDQVAWLEALAAYVEASEDLQLAVRIHPREGANKREPNSSQHLEKLKEKFQRPYNHCRFIWPQEPISSYDLAEAADLAVISWTTVGTELARLGVPALAAFGGINTFPRDDFLEGASTPEEYFETLAKLLQRPASLETISRSFRWHNLCVLANSIDLSDVVPHAYMVGLPDFKMPAEAEAIEQLVLGKQDVLTMNHDRLAAAQGSSHDEEERVALVAQLRRLLHYFCTGQDEPLAPLQLGRSSNPARRWVEVKDGWVDYGCEGRDFRRYSPLCARLVPLCAEGNGLASQ